LLARLARGDVSRGALIATGIALTACLAVGAVALRPGAGPERSPTSALDGTLEARSSGPRSVPHVGRGAPAPEDADVEPPDQGPAIEPVTEHDVERVRALVEQRRRMVERGAELRAELERNGARREVRAQLEARREAAERRLAEAEAELTELEARH